MEDTLAYQYPVMEHFATLQGEGYYAGSAAYFIRLGGCDVGCHWCDVKESWPVDAHPKMNVASLCDLVAASGIKLVVITGGEPCMHNLAPLTNGLKAAGFRTHIETSGSHPLSGEWDWITFSPKKFKAPLPSIYEAANELKVVVYNKSDFEFAASHALQVNGDCLQFLQPEWSKRAQVMPQIVSFVKANPAWRVSLQTHKYLDIP